MPHLPRRLSKAGPLVDYLNFIGATGDENLKAKARDTIGAVQRCLATPDGLILLELLENSTLNFFLPVDADPRALDALNAQRFIPLDLRRILTDENLEPEPERTNLLERRGARRSPAR